MAYIGNPPTIGQWRKLDDISGSFNGSTTTFTTSVGGSNVTAGSANQLIVSLGGVIQQPNVDYSVTTNSLIFTTAPASGLDFFAVLAGDALNAAVPADGTITTAKLAGNLTVDLDSGSAAAPSLTFDSNTGLFSPAPDEVSISTGGTERLRIDSAGQISSVSLGTAGAPTFSFTGDTNTGIYSPGADTLGFTTGGVEKLRLDSAPGLIYAGNGNRSATPVDTTIAATGAIGTSVAGASLTIQGGRSTGSGSGGPVIIATAAPGANGTALNAATERARIDSSGRLLVGTSSSQSQAGSPSLLQVESPLSGSTVHGISSIRHGGSTAAAAGVVSIGRSRATAAGGATAVAENDALGYLVFTGANGTDFDNVGASISAWADGPTFTSGDTTDLPGRLVFSTTADGASSPTERMRIDSGGNTILQTIGAYLRLNSASTNFDISGQPGGTDFIRINANNTQRFQFDAAGRAYNSTGTWGTISDVRLKENIVDASSKLEEVKRLRVVNYNLLSDPDVKQIGFVAQELEEVFPSLVEETGTVGGVENAKAVKTTVLVPVLVKALQEAIDKIETLEAKVAALESA